MVYGLWHCFTHIIQLSDCSIFLEFPLPNVNGHLMVLSEERMLSRPVMATSKSSQDPNVEGRTPLNLKYIYIFYKVYIYIYIFYKVYIFIISIFGVFTSSSRF